LDRVADTVTTSGMAPASRGFGRRDGGILAGLLVIGALLRVSTINTRGLWLDETGSLNQVLGSVWETILSQVGGTHPPLFHVLMNYWISWFGVGETAIRSFALVFGLLSIPLAYWAGKVAYDRLVGLIAATIITFSPFNIWYSQEARMYTMLMFFALLSVGCYVIALERNSAASWAGYFAASLAGAFTHYLFLFLILGQVLYFVLFEIIDREVQLNREGERQATWRQPHLLFADVPLAKGWLAANVALAVLVLLWMQWAVFFPPGGAELVGAVTKSGLGYGAPPPSLAIRFNDVIETLAELLVGSHSPRAMSGLVAMWPLFIYLALLAMDSGRHMTRRTTMLLCSMGGLLVVWGFGQWQGVVLLSRYLTPMAAPGLILVASAVAHLRTRSRQIVLVIGVLISLVAYGSQSFDPWSVLRYQNREAIQYVGSHQQADDLIIYEPFYIDNLINYYLPQNLVAYGFPRYGENGQFRDTDAQVYQDLARIVGPAKRVWAIRSFQNVHSVGFRSYKTDQWLLKHGFTLAQHEVLNKIEFSRFDRTEPPSITATEGVAP
jgi:uncharacterized membrane protein